MQPFTGIIQREEVDAALEEMLEEADDLDPDGQVDDSEEPAGIMPSRKRKLPAPKPAKPIKTKRTQHAAKVNELCASANLLVNHLHTIELQAAKDEIKREEKREAANNERKAKLEAREKERFAFFQSQITYQNQMLENSRMANAALAKLLGM